MVNGGRFARHFFAASGYHSIMQSGGCQISGLVGGNWYTSFGPTLFDLRLIFLRNLKQEPGALFGLIGPVIDKSIGCVVASLASQFLRFTELCHQLEII